MRTALRRVRSDQKSVTFPSSAGFQGTCVSYSFYTIHERDQSITLARCSSRLLGSRSRPRSFGRDVAVKDPNLMPKNNVSAYHTGPMASSCTCRAQTPVSEALSQTLPTTYLTFLTDKLRAKPFRVKFGGQNIIGFHATALEGATVLPIVAAGQSMPKLTGRTPDAAVAEGSTHRSVAESTYVREQVWNSDVGKLRCVCGASQRRPHSREASVTDAGDGWM